MKQVDAAHYSFQPYVTKRRFISYWYQVSYVLNFKPQTVLEIGPGPGVVTALLRSQNIQVTTLDFADDVGADVVASVLDLPLEDNSVDVVLCSQVLEHLPYDQFETALEQICRVTRKGAVISLPNSGRFWPFSFYLPKMGALRFACTFDPFPRPHRFDGEHYWEIGKRGYLLKQVKAKVKEHFASVEDVRLFENGYHHFFICKK